MLTFAVLTFPNIDPVLFSIGPFAVRWYALAYIVGLIFGIWYMKRLVSTPKLWTGTAPSATPQQIDDFFIWAMLGVVLGGRIGYLLFYGPGCRAVASGLGRASQSSAWDLLANRFTAGS